MEKAIADNITKLNPFCEGIIHGANIGGTPLSTPNDVIIKVIRITGQNLSQYNWYRVVLYDCQSSGIYTISNINGTWSGWVTIA